MTDRRVIGIGETVFDIIFRNNRPVGGVPGGSTFNSMISLGRCGVSAAFLSETGADKVGGIVCDYLESNGVSAADVDRQGKSHISLAFLNEQNDAEYVFYKDHPNDKANIHLPEIHKDDIVLFGSYYAVNPVIRTKVKSLLDYAKAQGAIIYYDLNFRAAHSAEKETLKPTIEENMRYADIVRGSNEDFDVVYGYKDFDTVYSKVFAGKGNVLYTCGARPTLMNVNSGLSLSMEIKPIEPVSTIGAGDNFNAGFIFSLIRDGITKEQVDKGLSEKQWMAILETAQMFSAECCQSLDNSVSESFAAKMRK